LTLKYFVFEVISSSANKLFNHLLRVTFAMNAL